MTGHLVEVFKIRSLKANTKKGKVVELGEGGRIGM